MSSMIRFQVAGTDPVFLRNRDVRDQSSLRLGQAAGDTDGSQRYAYDVALDREVYRWAFSHVPKLQFDRFEAWFEDVCKGLFGTFSVELPPGNPANGSGSPVTVANCKFTHAAIIKTDGGPGDGWYSFGLEFFAEREGPTGPPTEDE